MKRKIDDKIAAIIKQLLAKKYKPAQIASYLEIEYKVTISGGMISGIKNMTSYVDIRSDLNDLLRETSVPSDKIDIDKIGSIKWALTENFSMAEIMDAFKVSQQIISKVRRGIAPYWGVATEYNQKLSEMFSRRKIVNIDSRMILEIKKEFVKTNGNIKMTDLAKRLKISSTTVSSILSLREYNEVASSYNGRILSIEKKKAEENAKKRKFENINKKISSENKRNDDLLQKISQLSAKIETNKERILALKSI